MARRQIQLPENLRNAYKFHVFFLDMCLSVIFVANFFVAKINREGDAKEIVVATYDVLLALVVHLRAQTHVDVPAKLVMIRRCVQYA